MARVSILIAVYNAEVFLRRSLDSIIDQTMEDWECILVNDGSNDNSGDICNEYAQKDARFRICHKKNEGVSATREKALQMATGDYLIHVDPDDWIEPEMLQKIYTTATDTNADMVICDFLDEYPGRTIYNCQRPSNTAHDTVLRELFSILHGSCCNKFVKHQLFIDYDIHFPTGLNIGEDLFVNVNLLLHDINVVYLPNAFYHYEHRQNGTSIIQTQKNWNEVYSNQVDIYKPILGKIYPDIIETLQYRAKRECLIYNKSYNAFLSTCPELNGRIQKTSQKLPNHHLMSFASIGPFMYWISCRIWRIKLLLGKLIKH